MRVLLTGANGFIGGAVLARLKQEGHSVIAATRRPASPPLADGSVAVDFQSARPRDWLPHLQGVDAVVNCAGLLQDAPGRSVRDVHVAGAAALFEACLQAGVRRVVQVSALGIDREQPTAFSRSKLVGDEDLMARDLDWVILRPSVVVGRSAYGGSALFRGLAALPILPVMPQTGPLQIVQLDDLVRTVILFLQPEAPSRIVIDIAGPERLSFSDVVLAYRSWLGWPRPVLVTVPVGLSWMAYRLGDLLGLLGWRPPIRTTARREIARGATGDNGAWKRLTGIEPQTLGAALGSEPPSVQEKWFASLYLLKPLGLAVFSAFWIATGVISLWPGWHAGKSLLMEAGMGDALASLAVVTGALADIAIGVAIAFRPTVRLGLGAALGVAVAYTVLGAFLLPRLWADPLGPLLKVLPIIVLNLMLLAIRRDR